MTGRTLFIGLAIFLVLFGAGLYYALNYAHYTRFEEDRFALALGNGAEPLMLENVDYITGDSSPLKYRVCADEAALGDYAKADDATPLVAPRWFECFDAERLQAALDDQKAEARLLAANEPYGFNLIGMNYEGRTFIWRQLNACGEARFSGDPLPENCPEIPN